MTLDKPDLVVHPNYESALSNDYTLHSYFNVVRASALLTRGDAIVHAVDDSGSRLVDLVLEPFYDLTRETGTEPRCTSYSFDRPMKIYACERKAPRYVIWTKSDPLSVCATMVDRVNAYGLHDACQRAKSWASPVTRHASVAVFDLDQTLVDDRCRPLDHADTALEYAKRCYDIVVLWSHGSSLHVDECLSYFDRNTFDVVLSHDGAHKANKNLLYLYNYFPDTSFTKTMLIDDSPFNWTPEYERMIVPHECRSLRHVLPLL